MGMSGQRSDSAREAARRRDGRFGPQSRSEAAVDLDGAAARLRLDVAAAAGQGRDDVDAEIQIMLARPDLEPDYNLTSAWRRAVPYRRHRVSFSPADLAALPPDHTRRCRDFCFTQAARFGDEARAVPDEADRTRMEDQEWQYQVEDHAYATALADSYAYWACAFGALAEPDGARVDALRASIRQPGFQHSLAHLFRSDPAPEPTAEWAAATRG